MLFAAGAYYCVVDVQYDFLTFNCRIIPSYVVSSPRGSLPASLPASASFISRSRESSVGGYDEDALDECREEEGGAVARLPTDVERVALFIQREADMAIQRGATVGGGRRSDSMAVQAKAEANRLFTNHRASAALEEEEAVGGGIRSKSDEHERWVDRLFLSAACRL